MSVLLAAVKVLDTVMIGVVIPLLFVHLCSCACCRLQAVRMSYS